MVNRSIWPPSVFQAQGGAEYFGEVGDIIGATSPNCQHCPSPFTKSAANSLVAFPVCRNLVGPEFSPSGWEFCTAAPFVSMPKTSINKNGHMVFRNSYVRRSRQLSVMSSETNAVLSEESSDLSLWQRI
jgi:hypothetical protein